MTAVLASVAFERPWAWLLLALPLVLVYLARRRDRPPAWFTGAFDLWLRAAARRPEDAHARRRRVPPPVWLFALGLALAIAAAAGPRPAGPSTGAWRVIVDRSPSMYLARSPAPGAAARIEGAAALLAERLAGAELEWVDAGADPPVAVRASGLPEAWRTRPEFVRRELDWSAHDAPGTVWLTDARPSVVPLRATVAAGGGGAVPGLVGTRGSVGLAWDGVALHEQRDDVVPVRVELPERLLDAWSRLVPVWAGAREFTVREPAAGAAELRVRAAVAPGASARPLAFGRDGWRGHGTVGGTAPDHDAHGPLAAWLSADDGTVLVAAGPGRVVIAIPFDFVLDEGEEAFAVSFARLFDDCVQPAPGVVALPERAAAGAPGFALGAPPAAEPASRAAMARNASWLLALALAFVLGAILWTAGAARAGDAARAGG